MSSVMVASPQRPVRERNSKSLSPRRPGNIAKSNAKPQQPASASRNTKLNQKSIDRLRRTSFPRALGVSSGGIKATGAEFGGAKTERRLRVTPEGKGRGKDGQSHGAAYPLSFDNAAGDKADRAWEPEDEKSPEAFYPQGTKGTKRAYELALKAFQDLAREFDLPSSRRVVSPEAMLLDCVQRDGRASRNASGEHVSDQDGRTSRSASMPEQQPSDSDDDIDAADPATKTFTGDEDDGVASAVTVAPPTPQFCSADACSVRKDVTRKARRLPPPSATPSGAELRPQGGPVSGLGADDAARVGAEGRRGVAEGAARRLIAGADALVSSDISNGGAGGDFNGCIAGVSDHGSNNPGEEQQQRRAMSASHFDSRHIFSIYHERDLRERPTTCRTEYIRACAELSLSPIPVFDHLLAPGSRRESWSILSAEGQGEEGQGLDASSPLVFDLDLRSYGLGPKRSLALAAFLKTFHVAEIRSLSIEGCGVPESAMTAIAQALKEGARGLTSLDISANQIKRESTASLVAELLEEPASSLTRLRLRGCSLSLAALTALLLPMQYRGSKLKSLCLARNRLGGVGAGAALACLVDSNISLTELDLSDNRLGGQQLAMILQALAVNSSLFTLDVGWNSLCEDQVVDALVEALKENRTLTRLEVGYSGLGEEACLRLSEVLLSRSSGIRHLGVAGTAIGPFGAQALLLAMGVDGVGGASGSGDTDNDEAISDKEGARDENIWQPCGGRSTRSSRSSSNSSSTPTTNERIINRNSTRSSGGGLVGGGEGGGAGGGRAWRTIDTAHCCLARKASDDGSVDRASNASAFDPTAPNGDYTLDLSNALDRHVARRLQGLASTQSGKCWVQSKLNKKALIFPTDGPSSFELPEAGVLELTFAGNRPVAPPAWKEKHVTAALQKIELAGDGVDELAGVRLAETIMELHPVTVAQGFAMLSAFSSCARARVAESLIRHMPRTEDAEQILDGLRPSEREKVEDVGSMGLFMKWFSSNNPTCRYRLRLGIPSERAAANRLVDLNMLERRALQLAGMKDLSQNGDWDNFRNGTLDGNPFVYPPGGGWVPPPQGLLCIDYVSPLQPACVGGEEESPPSPMSDQEFRDFLAAYVVLEDEPAPLRSTGAEKVVAGVFNTFDQGGQDPSIAQALMTKRCGFPRAPNLQQVRDAIAETRLAFPSCPEHEDDDSSAVDGDEKIKDSTNGKTSDNDGADGADDVDAGDKVEVNKTEAGKPEEKSGEEGNGDGGGDGVDAETPLDLERFAHVWRLLMVRAFAERRLPRLRRLSSRVWLSTEQLSRMFYALKRDKRNPCDPVEAVVFFFRRLTDLENLHRFTTQLPDDDMDRVGDALGWLNVFNPFRPDGHYRLNLSRPDERRVAAAVMELVRVAVDAGKAALLQAFPSGAFGAHAENFVPPKTWKRVLPSSGRWSFKLALESRRIDPSSSPSSPSPNNVTSSSATLDGGDGAEAQQRNQQQQQQPGSSHNNESASDDQAGQKKEGAQTQERDTDDTAGGTPETPEAQPPLVDARAVLDANDTENKRPAAEAQEPSTAVAAQERGIDNWPGRAICREVSEKFLSWEFRDDDFSPPAVVVEVEGEVADSCFGDMEQQREEQAAVRAALVRRQANLLAALRGLKTNDEAGLVGAG